jgi:Mg2+ and Co2+ transporter CorA
MQTVSITIVEQIISLQTRATQLQQSLDGLTDVIEGYHRREREGTGRAVTCADQRQWNDTRRDIETRLWKKNEYLNRLKRDHGIFPYHDGATLILRPTPATLKPAVPAAE